MLLYSDGLAEAGDAGGVPFGYDALRAKLLGMRHEPPQTAVDALLAAVDRHRGGGPLDDDLTVLLVDHRRTSL